MNKYLSRIIELLFTAILLIGLLPVNFYADTETTDNLNNSVKSFEIINKETEKEIKPEDTVNTTDTYTVLMHFEENPFGLQFDDGEMYYTFPDGLEIASDDVNDREIKIDDVTVAVFTLIDHKTVKVMFVDDWPDVSLECKLNCDFDVMFKADDDISEKTIDLGDNNTITITIKKGADLKLTKEATTYDPKTHRVHYKVNATSNGEIKDAVFNDTYDNKMSLVLDSVRVNNESVTVNEYDPETADKKSFEMPIGDFVSGETKTITYEMEVDSSYLYKSSYSETHVENKAEINGTSDNKNIHAEDTVNYRVNHRNLTKKGYPVGLSDKQLIKWEIEVGDNYSKTNVGGHIIDELKENLILYNNGTEKPVTISCINENGEEYTIYADDLDSIDIPDKTRSCKIVYYTEYENASPVGYTTYENIVSIIVNGNKWTSYASTQVKGIAPSIHKKHTDVTYEEDGKISYKITSTVPAGTDKTDAFYIKDKLLIDIKDEKKNAENCPMNVVVKINNEDYEDFTVINNDDEFIILFGGKDLDDISQSKWMESSDALLEITYDISRSAKVIDEEENLHTLLNEDTKLLNKVTLYYSKDAYVSYEDEYQETVNRYMNKKVAGVNTANKTIEYEVEFMLDVDANNASQYKAHFIDDFDNRLEYVPDSFYIERIREKETDPEKIKVIYKATEGNEKSYIKTVDGNTYMDVAFEKLTPNGAKWSESLIKALDRTDVLVAHYTLKLKDEVIINPDSDVSNIYFDNTAYITVDNDPDRIVEDSAVAAYPNGLLTKNAVIKENKEDILTYNIHFNPSKRDLVEDSDELILRDKMLSDNLALHPDTIKVYKINDDMTYVELFNTYKILHGGTVIEFRLPDESEIEITYDTKVTEVNKDGVEVINKVELEGIVEINATDSQIIPVRRARTSAEGEHGKFYLFKTDEITGEPLKGAKFKLYTRKTDEIIHNDTYEYNNQIYYAADDPVSGKAMEFETNSLGYATVEHVVLTMDDEDRYLIVEEKAPDGYMKMDEPICFMFNPHSDVSEQFILNEGSLEITNRKAEGSLKINKTVTGKHIDASRMFSFKVVFDAEGSFDYDGSYEGSIKSNDIIKLRHNEEITIHNLPAGTTYKVTEIDADDYHMICSNDEGMIKENKTMNANFINSKTFVPRIPVTGIDR